MTRAYDDYLEKEANRKRAMKAKGHKQCEQCQEMFRPDPKEEFICKECCEKINDKD